MRCFEFVLILASASSAFGAEISVLDPYVGEWESVSGETAHVSIKEPHPNRYDFEISLQGGNDTTETYRYFIANFRGTPMLEKSQSIEDQVTRFRFNLSQDSTESFLEFVKFDSPLDTIDSGFNVSKIQLELRGDRLNILVPQVAFCRVYSPDGWRFESCFDVGHVSTNIYLKRVQP